MDLNIKDQFDFTNIDYVVPDVVIKELSDQLESITNGYVVGHVEPYDGPIESYPINGFAAISAALAPDKEYNIQDSLGKTGYDVHKFEFYITSTQLPNYQFRVLFFEYGIGGYPVKIVLEEGIAYEINTKDSGYTFIIGDRVHLEDTINKIMSSKRVIKIIQELINASLIAKRQKEESE